MAIRGYDKTSRFGAGVAAFAQKSYKANGLIAKVAAA